MHPFMDTSDLSDDELTKKLDKAYQYLQQQTGLGHTPTVESIKEIIETLELERSTRLLKAMSGDQKKIDESLKPIDIGTIEDDINGF